MTTIVAREWSSQSLETADQLFWSPEFVTGYER